MTDFDDLIGVPYVEDGRDPGTGLDCYGLVLVIAERIGRRPEWREVPFSSRQAGDVLALSVLGVPGHTGVVIDAERMIHAARGKGVCVERYTGVAWRRRVSGVFRFV